MMYFVQYMWLLRWKSFTPMHMYWKIITDITILTCSFTVFRYAMKVLTYPGYSTRFSPTVSLVWWVSDLSGWILQTACTWVHFLYLGLSWWKMKYNVSVLEFVSHTFDMRPSSLLIEFFHTGASFLTSSLYPKTFPVVSQWMWFAVGSTVIVFFGGLYVCHYLLLG